MSENTMIPSFGPLQGVRVLVAGSLIAAPFAASMMSDLGAEVILIERPGVGDPNRKMGFVFRSDDGRACVSAGFMQAARNRMSMTLDLNLDVNPECKKIFFDLIKRTDIFLDNLVWLDKFGLDDRELLELNPKLVIGHVSGYGNKQFGGTDYYCGRASYDIVAQAFSGYMDTNGEPDGAPMRVSCYQNDYTTAAYVAFGTLSAYLYAQKTGKGQVVDISQVEVQAKFMHDAFVYYGITGINLPRTGNVAPATQPYGVYPCGGGEYVAIGATSEKVFERLTTAIGLPKNAFRLYDVSGSKELLESPKGRAFDRALRDWLLEHTAEEIDAIFAEHRVPCSKVNKVSDCYNSQYFKSRNDLISYTDQTLKKEVAALGIVPKYEKTPGKVWRGAPRIGQDTDYILKELLSLSDDDVDSLREKKLI